MRALRVDADSRRCCSLMMSRVSSPSPVRRTERHDGAELQLLSNRWPNISAALPFRCEARSNHSWHCGRPPTWISHRGDSTSNARFARDDALGCPELVQRRRCGLTMSRLRTPSAFDSMNARRGSTCSPISVEKISSERDHVLDLDPEQTPDADPSSFPKAAPDSFRPGLCSAACDTAVRASVSSQSSASLNERTALCRRLGELRRARSGLAEPRQNDGSARSRRTQ